MKLCYLVLLPLLAGSLYAEGSLELNCGYQTRYMLQGYDLLTQGSLMYHEVVINEGGFSASAWYAEGADDPALQETVLHWGYGRPIGPVYLYAGYTFLHYSDEFRDSEWCLSLDGNLLPVLHAGALAYRSREGEGTFYEFSLDHEQALPWAEACITPTLVLGVNEKYVPDHKNGLHHIDLKLDGQVPLGWGLSLTAGVHEAIPLEEEGRDGSKLKAAFSYGLGLSWSR